VSGDGVCKLIEDVIMSFLISAVKQPVREDTEQWRNVICLLRVLRGITSQKTVIVLLTAQRILYVICVYGFFFFTIY
jgi:hypothetical protein